MYCISHTQMYVYALQRCQCSSKTVYVVGLQAQLPVTAWSASPDRLALLVICMKLETAVVVM
jgi:hypothetical protein